VTAEERRRRGSAPGGVGTPLPEVAPQFARPDPGRPPGPGRVLPGERPAGRGPRRSPGISRGHQGSGRPLRRRPAAGAVRRARRQGENGSECGRRGGARPMHDGSASDVAPSGGRGVRRWDALGKGRGLGGVARPSGIRGDGEGTRGEGGEEVTARCQFAESGVKRAAALPEGNRAPERTPPNGKKRLINWRSCGPAAGLAERKKAPLPGEGTVP